MLSLFKPLIASIGLTVVIFFMYVIISPLLYYLLDWTPVSVEYLMFVSAFGAATIFAGLYYDQRAKMQNK